MHKPTISLIIPCYNEEQNIDFAYSEITAFWHLHMQACNLELVFVDDGSKDATAEKINVLASKDPRVSFIQFSRNFGKEIATTAGIQHCTGDACIMFDADLQYPLEALPEFFAKWQAGYDVVVGSREKKQTNNIIEIIGSYLFYKIVNAIADIEVRAGALDYRLMDRKVIDEFCRLTERSRMTRALIDWLGFHRTYIGYSEKPRNAGEASYSFIKRVKLALNTFVGTSFFPLRLAGYAGVGVATLSGVAGVVVAINRFVLDDPLGWATSGSTSIGILVVFLTGINMMCMGLISLYIENIHVEVVNRPLYVVKNKPKALSNTHITNKPQPTVIHF
jgi:polyisoprenyl-phosphate glycosyltransferase